MERIRRYDAPSGKKRGPNGSLNAKQIKLVNLYCNLPHRQTSRYIAYIEAGYVGGRAACDNLFETEKISNAIVKRRQEVGDTVRDLLERKDGSIVFSEYAIQSLETFLARGLTYSKASQLAGVEYETMHKWIQKGLKAKEEDDRSKTQYIDAAVRLEAAKARGEDLLLAQIIRAGTEHEDYDEVKVETGPNGTKTTTTTKRIKSQWQAAAWVLERTRRDIYGVNAIPVEDDKPTAAEENEADADMLKMLLTTEQPASETIIDIEPEEVDEDDHCA